MGKKLLELDEDTTYKYLSDEFGKSKKDIDDSVKILEEWIKTQPHLPENPGSDVLRVFLIYNKFSIERCKERLDMYYTIRSMTPEMFKRHPCSSEMVEQSKITYCIPLPKLAPDNRRIMFNTLSEKYGPDSFDMEKYLCHIFNTFELLIREDLSLGYHFVFDAKSVKIGHVAKLSPMVVKKASLVMEKVFANRVASIHCFNYNSSLEKPISVIKSLLPSKVASRFHTHKNRDDLFTSFPKSVLPKDVGGDEDSIDELNNLWIDAFKRYEGLFDKLSKIRVNESLRPSKLVNDEVLGYYGNFKKLDID
ncbi:alpha-tocopherol transfer protein-like [Rhynchophorus ferrugineus]|uniref:CRAL-TRIO domain-containing protein n=1 Tax=Rhynchophorus ferrugineus TaxID=354439 RepID=A0A834M979_RHYFE|nr:hypothetical protein GWI33_014304 [Rhynchophorus ferrugineus]